MPGFTEFKPALEILSGLNPLKIILSNEADEEPINDMYGKLLIWFLKSPEPISNALLPVSP